jgi:hypothetical protein
MEMFNLNKLNKVECKEKYHFEVSNSFADLEDLDSKVEVNDVWKTIRKNIKISAKDSLHYYEMKKHKPLFVKRYLKLLDQRKYAKLQWLYDPNGINGNNLDNARHEASRHFRSKRWEYLKDKITEHATNRTRISEICIE